MKEAFIFDLGGTLLDTQISDKYATDAEIDSHLNEVNEIIRKEKLKPGVEAVYRALRQTHAILLVTSRPDSLRTATEKFLKSKNVNYEVLEMRKNHTDPNDANWKHNTYLKLAKKYKIIGAFDNEKKVTKMYAKEHGLEAYQIRDQNVE